MGKLVLLLIVLTGVLAAGTAHATAPGKNGRIAFRRYFDDTHTWGAVFTINADGTGERQVTRPAKGTVDDQPDWSPDGSLLAFSRRAGNGPASVYTVHSDGSKLTRISTCPPGGTAQNCSDDSLPAFSPSGRQIVFGSGRDIVIADLQNGLEHDVIRATSSYTLSDPQFSPDGTRVVFEKMLGEDGPRALFTVDVSGTHLRQVTAWRLDAGDNPDWSPDGKWILFRTHERHDGKPSQIDLIHPDGSGLRQLTRFKQGAIVTSSSFSPDGQSIVYASTGVAGNADLYVMRTDGAGVHPITRTKTWESAPDWGPSG